MTDVNKQSRRRKKGARARAREQEVSVCLSGSDWIWIDNGQTATDAFIHSFVPIFEDP